MRRFLSTLLATALAAGLAAPVAAAPIVGPDTDRLLPGDLAAARGAKARPTDAAVGDADSFGRNLRWLGVADMVVELRPDCSLANPDTGCQELAPSPALTAFAFEDLGRIELPARATHSLLCHWFSPFLNIDFHNPGVAAQVGQLTYLPTLTVENPVLATPGLVDATTGLPFAGRLTTSMTASEIIQVPLPAGAQLFQRSRDTATCIAGFLTRESLVQVYGLSEAQADAFFREPTTVRMNLRGSAQYVDLAQLYFGLRIVGD